MEPAIPLRQIDLLAQVDLLHQLGADFAAVHTEVAALEAEQIDELLGKLSPQILATHELVGRTIIRLAALDRSQYTVVPGSRVSLRGLGTVVAYASVAASALGRTVADIPLDSTPFGGVTSTSERDERRTKAVLRLSSSLGTAAHHLDLCAQLCASIAIGITRDLKRHPEHLPHLPQLTGAQYAALERIALGGAVRYVPPHGTPRVTGHDGKTFHSSSFGILDGQRLVHVDRSSPGYVGQDVVVTTKGRLVLDLRARPRVRGTAPAAAPVPRDTGGRHR